MNDRATPPAIQRAGPLETAVLKLFTRAARVLDVEDIGDAFRIVTLGGDALRDVAWTPGDKIQLQLGGWTQRTYTPMGWDAESGRTRILAYLHAGGPGAQWARTLRRGDACTVFGPRKSIRLAAPQAPIIVFGDETSLGLAAALADQMSAPTVLGLFEVTRPTDAEAVVHRLQLQGAVLCTRLANDGHFNELETRMSALLQAHPTAHIVLTGQAGAIQRIGKLLKRRDIAAGRRHSKAYWAPGKTGMD